MISGWGWHEPIIGTWRPSLKLSLLIGLMVSNSGLKIRLWNSDILRSALSLIELIHPGIRLHT
jgi:hypothetical protein